MEGVRLSWLPVALLLLAGCVQPATPVPDQADALIEAASIIPTISLEIEPDPTPIGEPVRFRYGLSEPSEVTGQHWDFGDGTSSPARSPEHVYRRGGSYDVVLTVQGNGWSDQITGRITVVHDASESAPVEEAEEPAGPTAPSPSEPAPPTITTAHDDNRVAFTFSWEKAPDTVSWDFGDGAQSNEVAPIHEYRSTGTFDVRLRVEVDDILGEASIPIVIDHVPFGPHVLVAIGDSGFNVYHDVYSRPEMTEHPCTYILDYPCHVPALELSLDLRDWHQAFEKDRSIWDAIRPGDAFWIPGTNIVYATCQQPYEGSNVGSTDPTGGVDHCILDDTSMHGTGTSSSVLSENPDALLAIAEGNSGAVDLILDAGIPVDIVSHSWGAAAPLPLFCSPECTGHGPMVVVASGNEGAFPFVLDGSGSSEHIWGIGAADAGSRSEPGYSGWKTMDFVSEYCRQTADTETTHEYRSQYCGTSFSAPTFAGALSRVVYELRQMSGYPGSMRGGLVDPILGISEADLREAINHTATYEPEDQWDDGGDLVPLVAPWYQWGWGYFDGTLVDEALACLLEGACPERPVETVTYMEGLWAIRQATP